MEQNAADARPEAAMVVRIEPGVHHLPALMSDEFGIGRSEARRLIDQGAVRLGDDLVQPGEHDWRGSDLDGKRLSVGARRDRQITVGASEPEMDDERWRASLAILKVTGPAVDPRAVLDALEAEGWRRASD